MPDPTHRWSCIAGPQCPTGGRSRRPFTDAFFARRAARNHTLRHGCLATAEEA